jgi:argininosuccinate lyase
VSTGQGNTQDGALWGGRFGSGPAWEMAILSKSTHFDWQLAPFDLAATRAHAKALHQAGYLERSELDVILAALGQIQEEFMADTLRPKDSDEDVHGALERELIERVGADIGGKVRAGRSRNDQIATFVRMYAKGRMWTIRNILIETVRILIARSDEVGEAMMPGRTHFQHAQPILVAHWLLAHAWPLLRDIERIHQWAERNNLSPYGSGALAGGGLGIDPEPIAQELGFDGVLPNSLDATSSRDVVAEALYIMAQVGVDISRMSEEIVAFTTAEFSYITLDDAYATGSSMMPQKKNPDVAELARGKTGRLIGNLTGLLATLKALPLAYNRDLQEDKEPLFDSAETLIAVLPAFAGMVGTMVFNLDTMAKNATAGFALATDVADWLVVRGVAFREAHEIAGALVSACEAKGVDLDGLSDEEYLAISGHLHPSVIDILSADESVAKKNGPAGTAPTSVAAQREKLRTIIESFEQ